MNGTDRSEVQELLDKVTAEKERRLEDKFNSLDKALQLSAKEIERRLEAYPTLRDFNDLKGRVDTVIALFQVTAVLAVIVGGAGTLIAFLGK